MGLYSQTRFLDELATGYLLALPVSTVDLGDAKVLAIPRARENFDSSRNEPFELEAADERIDETTAAGLEHSNRRLRRGFD